ncbi:vacuolar sorting protein [Scheffersomyces coipomensis]|uniref:vacuolar sorting protein n=1 Tax=Scheffersomyces coipomensis TaxID=1788519 RepID=UPI00315D1AB3
MPSNPSSSWLNLQNIYYSLNSCYDNLNWSIANLYTDYKVAISGQTTLLALSSKHVPHPNIIEIYSISGDKLWSIVYNNRPEDHIVDYHFRNEDLCLVFNNNRYRYYSDFKTTFNEYDYTENIIKLENLSSQFDSSTVSNNGHYITDLENNETEEVFQVLEVKLWKDYLVIRQSQRIIISDLNTFTNYEISLQSLDSTQIHNICFTSTTNDILISYKDTVIVCKVELLFNNYELIDQGLTDGPFTSVSPSPNGELICLFNDKTSTVYVINNKFDRILLEYNTSDESSIPYQIAWCGGDVIVLSLRDEIKLIGPGQSSISHYYDLIEEDENEDEFDLDRLLRGNTTAPIVTDDQDLSYVIPILKTESDGLKIITSNKIQFLSRASDSAISLYQIGSSHPASILLDCIDKLAVHSSKADTNISLLKADGTLLTAMKTCLTVALEEFNPFWQKKILKAVSFGKAYYDDGYYNSDDYLNTLNTIRVLNQLRSSSVGIFLTINEILEAGWKEVILMLLRRDLHLIAIKVIESLKLTDLKSLVYVHWCCYKIRKEANSSDAELFDLVKKKLTNDTSVNTISMEKISQVAYEEGRINLCKLLIKLEPSIKQKMLQFLKYEELELALTESIQSGEYDLSRIILLYLQDTLTLSQFFRVLNQNEIKESEIVSDRLFIGDELVGNLWINGIGKDDIDTLEAYYTQEDKIIQLSNTKLKIFIEEADDTDESYYKSYKSRLQKSINRSNIKRINKLYQHELDILELQKRLGETYLTNFYNDKAISSILVRLIGMNQLKPAAKIVKDFKVTPEKYWNLVVETYASAKEFEKLYGFITDINDIANVKSPIGFQPFVEACFKYGGPKDHITNYIKNCTNIDYSERVKYFVKNQDYELAGQEAFKVKDVRILRDLLKYNLDDQVKTSINEYIAKLGY